MRAARIIAGVAALLAGCAAEAPEAPEARMARLAPHARLLMPDGPGPHPAAILLSGCDGVHDNMGLWAEAMVEAGRAALILDSHGARGIDRLEAGIRVCTAERLRGPERAGDVAVALDALAETDGIDATDVVLLGASHGGWAAMEFMALAGAEAPIPGLGAWPAPPASLRARVSGLVLIYPYCGVLNDVTAAAWADAPPTLMILGEDDRIVSTPACLARAEALRAGGADVRAEVIAGADHGFDQRERIALSPLRFDAAHTARARALVDGFLAERAPPA